MNLRILALSALAVALNPLSVRADGYSRPVSVYSPVPFIGWTGFYIGSHLGGAWSDVSWENVNLTGERVNNDATGFIGGGQIGYNQQFGSVVLGVEGTLSSSSLDGDFRSGKKIPVTYGTEVSTIATLTGRLGFTANQWLVYGKAGWAGAQVDVSGQNAALGDSFSFDDWRSGWTVGAGIDYKVARNISLGVEYSFIGLGGAHYHGSTALGLPINIVDHDVQVQSLTARLNFHLQ
jgi:outer membrane immunogenic protein